MVGISQFIPDFICNMYTFILCLTSPCTTEMCQSCQLSADLITAEFQTSSGIYINTKTAPGASWHVLLKPSSSSGSNV